MNFEVGRLADDSVSKQTMARMEAYQNLTYYAGKSKTFNAVATTAH